MSWRSEAEDAYDRWQAANPLAEAKIVETIEHKTIVDSLTYTIEEERWDTASPTFHVYDDQGECLTANDAFEHMPTDDEIRNLT